MGLKASVAPRREMKAAEGSRTPRRFAICGARPKRRQVVECGCPRFSCSRARCPTKLTRRPSSSPQPLKQFPVYSSKSSIAENTYDLAALNAFGHVSHNGVRVGKVSGVLAGSLQILQQAR